MIKKVFAVTAVSSLALLTSLVSASGCSSTEVITQAAPDAATEAKAPTSSGGLGDAEEAPTGPTCESPPTSDPATLPYLPAAVIPGACNEAALTAVHTLVANNANGVSLNDIKASLAASSAACAACAWATPTDHWAPIVDEGNNQVIINTGGCMEVASGNAACGKAWFQLDSCVTVGCANCTTDADESACFQALVTAPAACAAVRDTVTTACGANVSDYLDECFPDGSYRFEGSIRAQCIGPNALDGGVDSGPKDAATDG